MRTIFFAVLSFAAVAQAQASHVKTVNAQPLTPQSSQPLTVLSPVAGDALVTLMRPGAGLMLARANPSASGLTFIESGLDVHATSALGFGSHAVIANNGADGLSLLDTDGTLAGTVPVPFNDGFSGASATVLGAKLLYSFGRQIRAWDGSTSTLLVTRSQPITMQFQVAGSKAYFLDFASAYQLWVTDGTPGGTSIVANACSRPNIGLVGQFGGKLLYTCGDSTTTDLLRTDGVTVSTAWFTGGGNAQFKVANVAGGKVLVRASGSAPTPSLYLDDGLGNTSVPSLPSPPNTTFFDFGPTVNGKALLIAAPASGAVPRGMIASDGTTSIVLNANLSPLQDTPYVPTPTGVIFLAKDLSVSPDPGYQVWLTDGTAAGTKALSGVASAALNGPNLSGTLLGTSTIFSLNDDTLYVVNASGVASVLFQLPIDAAKSLPTAMTALSGRVLFGADDGLSGTEPWVSDGTAGGTFRLADLYPGASPGFASSSLRPGTAAGTGLTLFWGRSGTTGLQPYVTDGGSASLLAQLASGLSGTSAQSGFVPAGRDVWFVATSDDAGTALFRSDGTSAGTRPVLAGLDLGGGRSLTAFGVDVLFWDAKTDSVKRVQASDGGVVTLFAGTTSGHTQPLRVVGRRIYFGSVAVSGRSFVSDGTTAGTRQAFDLGPTVSFGDTDWAPLGTGFVTLGRDLDAGQEPWAVDDTAAGPRLLADIYPGGAWSSSPGAFTAAGGRVFFTAVDPAHGRELWVTDGTTAGTTLVKDIGPGPFSGVDGNAGLFAVGNSVYFAASDGVHGVELWTSDGTATGTTQVADVNAGAYGSSPAQYGTVGCAVGFFAYGSDRRQDLWTAPLPSPATVTVGHVVSGALDGGWYHGTVDVEFDVQSAGPVSRCPPEQVTSDTAGITFTCAVQSACGGASTTDSVIIRRDDTPPTFTACDAGPVLVEAHAPDAGLLDASLWPQAADAVSTVTVTLTPDLRSPLGLGDTLVTATATDEAGNAAPVCHFAVRVRDTTAPTLVCPGELALDATSPAGATVRDFRLLVYDAVDPSPRLEFSVDAGAVFPLGNTPVQVTAVDASNNRSTPCGVDVRVREAPVTLACPADVAVSSKTEGGEAVTFDVAAHDGFGGPASVSAIPASGSVFAPGTTTVNVTATSPSGQSQASCAFTVTVKPLTLPRYGFGCASASAGPLGLLALLLLAARRRRGSTRAAVVAALAIAGAALAGEPVSVQGKTAAFMGLSAGPGIDAKTAETLSSVAEARLAALGYAQLTSQAQVATLLGVERQKQLLGCSDGTACIEELAGALNATHVITGTVGVIEGSVVCTLSLVDAKSSKALGRVTRRAKSGGVDAIIDELPDMLEVLYSGDVGSSGEATASARGLIVGARLDGDVVGGLTATAANVPLAPGLTAEWSERRFGLAGTLFAQTRVGGRVEGRLFLTEGSLRPWVAVGGAAFIDGDLGVHASVGAGTHFGPVHVALDVGGEYYPKRSQTVTRVAGLVGLRVGMRL